MDITTIGVVFVAVFVMAALFLAALVFVLWLRPNLGASVSAWRGKTGFSLTTYELANPVGQRREQAPLQLEERR